MNVTNNQGISTHYEFDIKKWRDSEDQVIEFPVQSYSSNIAVTISAKIQLQSKK